MRFDVTPALARRNASVFSIAHINSDFLSSRFIGGFFLKDQSVVAGSANIVVPKGIAAKIESGLRCMQCSRAQSTVGASLLFAFSDFG